MHEPDLHTFVVSFEVSGMTRPLKQIVIAHTDEEARLIFAQRMPGGKVLSVELDEAKS